MVLVAAATTFWFRALLANGFRSGELSLLALLWVAPIFPSLGLSIGVAVPIGLILLGTFIVVGAVQSGAANQTSQAFMGANRGGP